MTAAGTGRGTSRRAVLRGTAAMAGGGLLGLAGSVLGAGGASAAVPGPGPGPAPVPPPAPGSRVIAWGTTLDPRAQTAESAALARSLVRPGSPGWRAKGDQHRSYAFPAANATVPYRICVPPTWNGRSPLPLVVFLHGAGNDENGYLDQNDQQLVKLAAQHGYLLVSPLGYQGAYGSLLRLPAVFGQQAEADKYIAARTPEREKVEQLSEKDVVNVLELVLAEYPVDRDAVFLTGHSMGSGGTWYLGAKYPHYWKAIAPMSGPFVQKAGYPWAALRPKPIFVTEGTNTPSLAGSRALRDWLAAGGFRSSYEEVDADHPGMVPLVLPHVFDVFDRCRRR